MKEEEKDNEKQGAGQMKRCVRCVLPETCPNIEFDESGVCNVCKEFDKHWGKFKQKEYLESKRMELGRTFDLFRKRGRQYDCLVPISGGMDSTYVLYICKKVYNLRVLAFTFDNGFQSEFAKENLKNITTSLDVDFMSYAPDWKLARKLYALFFRKTGEFCTPCNVGIWSTSYKIARDSGIPLIVKGSSRRIEEQFPKGTPDYYCSSFYFKEVIRGEMPFEDAMDYLHTPHNLTQRIGQWISKSVPLYGIKTISLPDYLEWNLKTILRTLEVEVDWKRPPEKHRHFDCIMDPVATYLTQKKMGFSAASIYSTLARDGQMTREEALRRTIKEERMATQDPPELELWFRMLGLSRKDLDGFEKRRARVLAYIPFTERLLKTVENTAYRILKKSPLIT